MEGKNAAKEGQCTRNPFCTKGKGHAGWCKTKEGNSRSGGTDQDSLFAALSNQGRKQPARSGGKQEARAAAMRELARKREVKRSGRRAVVASDDEDEDDDDDEYDDGEEEVEEEEEEEVKYDYGMSKAERRAMRDRPGTHKPTAARQDDGEAAEEEEDGEAASQWEPGGGPVQLAEMESIRLRRMILEKWLLEPFFARVVRGCFVRIGLQTEGQTLYRCAEVTGVQEFEDLPYMLGPRRTCKRLQLEFGESRQWYPMSSVSNQPFEELELISWQQVLEVNGRPVVSANQLKAKTAELHQAHNYAYSESDVTRRIQDERKSAAQAGKPATLTTRQKMQMQQQENAARPKKFQRNVLGQAIVAEHE